MRQCNIPQTYKMTMSQNIFTVYPGVNNVTRLENCSRKEAIHKDLMNGHVRLVNNAT